MEDAEHEETAPSAPTLLISKLTGSLVGKTQTIKIQPDSLLHKAYGREEGTEHFACNYGFNPRYRGSIEDGRLKITGVDLAGQVRVMELSEHPFYVGTLYLPQLSSTPESPHPLIVAYLRAALDFRMSGKNRP
jgi:CTP synthase (UTP-ammonia lyase)